ncbi:MAG: hypothetical protein LBE33_06395 [Zoogloeaceae bacterium]|jgi:hypothetical protein|nr:hypothetical protein [Zoogloeaceae bacterium]
MDFNAGEWIVKALELLKESSVLRRMYYWTLAVFALYGLPALVRALHQAR